MEPDYKKDEIDWKDLMKRPEKLFGYSYIYFIMVLIGIGVLYISNINTTARNTLLPAMSGDSSAMVQDIQLQSPRVVPPVDIMKASIPAGDIIEKGSGLFKMNCSSCHGDDGLGDGPTAAMLDPKPRNFHSLSGWKNGSKITQIYTTLENGIPESAMPAYNYLAPADRIAMIHFVRTLTPEQPKDSEPELRQLEQTYRLSEGMNVAGQIPVKKALQVMIKEEAATVEAAKKGIEVFDHLDGDGAELLHRMSNNKERVIAGLLKKSGMLAGTDNFIRLVSSDPDQYGFRPAVIRLSEDELQLLVETLRTCSKEMRR
jgi:mono/diheme cytochrome c family protein